MVARPLEFLSTSLLRAPPLEMRWERQESFPDKAGKGTFISRGGRGNGAPLEFGRTPVFFLSSDGYVGELLELQQVCEGPVGISRGQVY